MHKKTITTAIIILALISVLTVQKNYSLEIPQPAEEVLVIAGIPFQDKPVKKIGKPISRPAWKEVENVLPALKDTGVNAIFIWAPYDHTVPVGEIIKADTAEGKIKLKLGYNVHIKDYLKPDPLRGSEEDFLHLIHVAHTQGIKVIVQLQVTLSTPGDYIYDQHPEWLLKSIYGNPAILWPWGRIKGGFAVNKADPGFINYVTDTIIPQWVKNWGVDGIYLDSPIVSYCDMHTKDLIDKTANAKEKCLTPVEGYYSSEPLVKAIKEKVQQLEKDLGKKIIFSGENIYTTWRDMPDDLVMEISKGNYKIYQTDFRVNRNMGKYFSWIMGYDFRALLKDVYVGGKYSCSENYIKYFDQERQLNRRYTEIARFVNLWINPGKYYLLLQPKNAENYLALLLTAPGKVIFIGEYHLPPQTDYLEKFVHYNSSALQEWYRKLIKIKKDETALQSDNIEDALIAPKLKKVIAYNRWEGDKSATVIVNCRDKPAEITVKTRFERHGKTVSDLLSGEKFSGGSQELKVNVPARGTRILSQN